MPVIADAPAAYSGLELLATAVFLLQFDRCIAYANPAAENLFEMSRTKLIGQRVNEIFGDAPALSAAIDKATASGASYTEQELELSFAFPAPYRRSKAAITHSRSSSGTSISN